VRVPAALLNSSRKQKQATDVVMAETGKAQEWVKVKPPPPTTPKTTPPTPMTQTK
jgi:hypothetical protein